MRNMAYQLVRRLVTLAQKETRADSVQGKEKFIEQFVGENEDDDVDAQQQQVVGEQGKQKTKGIPKPAEHRALFRGNKDDHFRWVMCVCVCLRRGRGGGGDVTYTQSCVT